MTMTTATTATTTTIVAQPQTLYHTDYDAFARAFQSVAPEIGRTATEYRAKFASHGLPMSEHESLGRAVAHLIDLVSTCPPADPIEEDEDSYYDRIYAANYADCDVGDYDQADAALRY